MMFSVLLLNKNIANVGFLELCVIVLSVIFLFSDIFPLASARQALLQEMQGRYKAGSLNKGKLCTAFKAIQIH